MWQSLRNNRKRTDSLRKTTLLGSMLLVAILVVCLVSLSTHGVLAATTELIQTGDLEIDDYIWLGFAAEHTSERAHTGSYSAKLIPSSVPGNPDRIAMLGQTITIPADTSLAAMEFYWKNEGIDAEDFLTVLITDAYPFVSNQRFASEPFSAPNTNWQKGQLTFSGANLDVIRGQTVTVWLVVYGFNLPDTIYIDDVSFTVTQNDPVTDTPTASATQTDTPTASPTQTDTPTASPTQTATGTASPTQAATGTASATQTDTPTVSPTQTDTPTASLLQTASSWLKIEVRGSEQQVVSGAQMTYTVNIHNNGPDVAEEVVVSITLSDGLLFMVDTPASPDNVWDCFYRVSTRSFICERDAIDIGAAPPISLIANVTAEEEGMLKVAAEVFAATLPVAQQEEGVRHEFDIMVSNPPKIFLPSILDN